MYCKYCGEHNSNNQTYCQKCGNLIKTNTIPSEDLNITEGKSAFCKKCGSQVFDRYCSECGTVGYVLDINHKKSKSNKPIINLGSLEMDNIKSKFGESALGDIKSVEDVKEMIKSKPVIKSSAISAAKILGIGLIISFVLFMIISKTAAMEQILHAIDMVASYSDQQITKLKPNFIDFFNLSLLSPIKLTANLSGEEYGEKISMAFDMLMSFKLLILLLIPAIGVFIGQLKLFKDESSTEENLLEYGVTSLIFSVMVKIIAFASQKSVKVEDPYDSVKIVLNMGFKGFLDLISVFLLIFIIHLVASMIIKKDNPFAILNIKQYSELGDRTHTYIKSMAAYVGIVSTALILTFLLILGKEGMEFKDTLLFGLLALPTGFVHAWLLSFGNGMSTVATGQSPVSLNIANMWEGIGNMKEASYGDSTAWAIWGYILIISIVLGLIYVLYKTLKDIEKEGYFVKLGYIAGVISLVNMLMAYLVSSGIKVGGKSTGGYELGDLLYEMGLGFFGDIAGSGAVKMSYPLFTIILTSFVWVFAIGAIIYFARENDVYHKVVYLIEDHNLKLIAGYSVVILLSSYLLQTEIIKNLVYELMNLLPLLDMLL